MGFTKVWDNQMQEWAIMDSDGHLALFINSNRDVNDVVSLLNAQAETIASLQAEIENLKDKVAFLTDLNHKRKNVTIDSLQAVIQDSKAYEVMLPAGSDESTAPEHASVESDSDPVYWVYVYHKGVLSTDFGGGITSEWDVYDIEHAEAIADSDSPTGLYRILNGNQDVIVEGGSPREFAEVDDSDIEAYKA